MNHRYGEFERRVLDYFAANPASNLIFLPGGMDLLVHYLVSDGYLARANFEAAMYSQYDFRHSDGTESTISVPSQEAYFLTPSGLEFLHKWQEAKPLDDASEPD